ncbi:MAG TPA: hypothetical protein DEA43_03620 [Candidatus Moranbacteria bacterium]|nr:hypothetical protein [Candidatus Moranbacteria bacterium]HBT45945.1 hypothetical protein [Candidatus Moranbacteria bacterium]
MNFLKPKFYLLTLLACIGFFVATAEAQAATRTISDAGGNWDATTSWVEGAVPTSADDVVATATSGNLTINVAGAVRSIDLTTYTGTLTHNAFTLSVGDASGGALNFSGSWTYTTVGDTSAITFGSSDNTNNNITWGGKIYGNIVVSSSNNGTTFVFQDNLTQRSSTATFNFFRGNLNVNGKNLSVGRFFADQNYTRGLTLGAANITLNGTGNVWSLNSENLGLSAGTSIINITDTSASTKSFVGGGLTFNNISITGGGTGAVTFTGSNTFNNFTINAPKTVIFTAGTTQTINGLFNATGTSGNIITINSSSAGSPATLSKASGVVTDNYLSLQDIAATGGAAWYAGANSTNVSGNSGWSFSNFPGIFYSVGQSTADLKTGTPTVTIASGVATFSAAQTGNIGVGDRVTYNTTDIAYIASKTSTSVWTLVTKTGAVPADITDSAVVSIKHEYTSLSAAEAGAIDANHLNTTDLVAGNYQLNFPCYYDSGADTTSVVVSGYTTGVNNFIKIYTPNNTTTEANNSQRHSGKWDDGKYRLEKNMSLASTEYFIQLNLENIIFDGLQVKTKFFDTSTGAKIGIYGTNNNLVISNNVSKADFTAVTSAPAVDYVNAMHIGNYTSGGKSYVSNNIVYDYKYTGLSSLRGIYSDGAGTANIYFYNNTLYNNYLGLSDGWNNSVAKNNIANENTVDYASVNSFDASSSNNISKDATSPNATFQNKTVSFVDAANKDFHLSPNDTVAKNAGADLSADPNFAFATDIDGNTRPAAGTVWDIGADEAANAVYYSVGQNTTDHKTGTPTVTIANGVATFSVAQTATNLGVGDKVTYNTTDVAYIASKTSTSVWNLVTATGGVPADITTSTVVSIAHSYASLSAAEAGAVDADHLNTTDLVSGNYQLNFPCYYDSGADITSVSISGYTTGVSNYIKIYTPVSTATEANANQRHQGRWDDGKYRIEIPNMIGGVFAIGVSTGYVRIDGLQIKKSSSNYAAGGGINMGSSIKAELYLSNNIIQGAITGDQEGTGIYVSTSGAPDLKLFIWNNIIYGFINTLNNLGKGIYMNTGTIREPVLYNNTIQNSYFGIKNTSTSAIAKNNVIQNCFNGFDGSFTASSDYNISDLAADAPGANSKNSTTVTFADLVNKDFHLSISDTAAKNFGVDLSSDSSYSFTTDIDGQTRPSASNTTWDIGADEASAQIFYSVGQSVADLKTGTPTVTIASGVATFSAAQTGNIGVGDRVTYNTTDIAYIASKTSTSVWTLVTKTGAAPADITTSTVVSIKHEYTSLSAAVTGAVDANHLNTTNLVTGSYQLNFPCYYDSGADTTAVNVTGYTTGANNYIKIYTPNNTSTEVNNSQRHQGRWDDRRYILKSNAGDVLVVSSNYSKIEGIQIDQIGNNMYFDGIVASSSSTEVFIYENIIRYSGVDEKGNAIYLSNNILANSKIYIYNNVMYGWTTGIAVGGFFDNSVFVYNNTIYGNTVCGINESSYYDVVAVNNLSYNNGNFDYCTTGTVAINYSNLSKNNLSEDSSAPGANSKNSTTVSFTDPTNKDFHLSPTDTAAKNEGTDLSSDPNLALSTDIDGQTRSGNWDIGADEGATAIYRSVGPSASGSLALGTSNALNISGSTATFASALPDYVGVGDALQYDSDNNGTIDSIAFIHDRTSSTVFTIARNDGSSPTATTAADNDWAIYRAHQSLQAAEAGTENSSINVAVRSFDSWSGGVDLVAGNKQWNIAAYANGSTADATSATIITGWETSPSNNIRIYTPIASNEVGISQRHDGKWNDNAYKIVQTSSSDYHYGIYNQESYVTIDGLQIKKIVTGGYLAKAITNSNNNLTNVTIKNNILAGEYSGTSNAGGGTDCSIRNCYVFNNIIYGFKNGSEEGFIGINLSQSGENTAFIYNNTIYGSYKGIYSYYSNKGILKNNIANGNDVDYATTFDASSASNISQDATSPNVALRNKTVSFVDAANKDFHLAVSDTVAKKMGLNLQTDTYLHFGEDIDGQGRAGNWDIGADELAEVVQQTQQPSPNLDAGLVGHWTFDGTDISGTTAKDISGNNNDGTINGATKAIGKLGQGLSFNGTSSLIAISNFQFPISNKFSISQWTNFQTLATAKPIVSQWGASNNNILLKTDDTNSNQIRICIAASLTDNCANYAYTSDANFLVNSWNQMQVVYDGTQTGDASILKFYLNGVQKTLTFSGTISTTLQNPAATLEIGGDLDLAQYLSGKIDDIRIYNRALSPNEISQLYHKGRVEVRETGTTTIRK